MNKKILIIIIIIFSIFGMKNVNAATYQFNLDYDKYFTEKVLERLEYIQKEFVDSGFLDQYENYYIYIYDDAYYIKYGNVEYSYYAGTRIDGSQVRTTSNFMRNNSDSINYGCSFGYMSYTLDQFKDKVSECKSEKTPTMSDNSGGGVYPYFVYFYLYSSNKSVKKLTYDEAILLNNRLSDTTPANISINGKLVDNIYKSYLELSIKNPEFEFEISENKNGSKNLILKYKNMNDNYYSKYYDLTYGIEKYIEINENNQYIIENINLDTILTVSILKKENNEIVFEKNIDFNNLEINEKKDPYVKITGYNQDNKLNSVFYSYFNTTKNMKCYYQFSNEEIIEENCNDPHLRISEKNTYLNLFIKDKNNKIIYQKNINLNFLKNYPQIQFNSYFDVIKNVQIVEINISNYQEGDIFYYSFDNSSWSNFNDPSKILDFYMNSKLFVKVIRNNEVISNAYIDVIYKSFINDDSNGIDDDNNILDNFADFTKENFKIMSQINDIWIVFKNSRVFLYFIILISGTIIILIVSSINR